MKEVDILAFINVAYPIFAISVLFSQALLLLLIFKNQTKLLRTMRIYLLNICAAQVVTIISGFLTQCRMIPNQTTVAFVCTGVCIRVGRRSCFLLHLLRDASSMVALFAIVHVFYYRYKILSHQKLSSVQIMRNFIIVHLPAIFCAICQFINPSQHNAIVLETRALHPSYIFEQNSIFGFSALTSPAVKASTIIFTIVLVLNPLAAIIYRNKIWGLLNEYEEYKSPRIKHAKSMITGLTIQTLIPSICFVPLVVQFFLTQYSEAGVLILEYFNSFLVILPTLIDPILSIVFVIPFRRMFFKYLLAVRQCRFSLSKLSDNDIMSKGNGYSAVRAVSRKT
ncbi:G-protein coupled receptors family 1 profile domain-containing protein [Caenorhabditis elegans]|uniref:G-protein coupled receptors family 1 profile domain-containing protein n=1 Tax=Caenorhabditis elegans TaxID=6239 RepID=Q21705_CAEEL|nr:G-protein coupled receptors family 1 profile domain-containing protein [Caenorhabditis elegans]CAA94844.1 G-protein coupled receptors family 1 profile domain-containing protein [Caenorhabditis elegans]|eukprot:NP_505594.1 Serpentine Receptor, class D (delta) [Caenorhabditis elegans]